MDADSDGFIASLPSDWQVEELNVRPISPLQDLHGEIVAQLADPLATLPLTELCGAGTSVVIACDDAPRHGTRLAILDGVLGRLAHAGVDPSKITVLVAARPGSPITAQDSQTGATLADIAAEWTSGYASQVRVVVHDPDNLSELDDLGNFEGVPLAVNFRAAEADLLIAISVLRLDDAWSDAGGEAAVTLGLGGFATVREMRTTRFFDDRIEGVGYGRPLIERVLREGARRAGLVFAIDAIEDARGCALALKAGAPNAVSDATSDVVLALREMRVSSSAYDVILAESGQRSPGGLYDASRAAINIGLARGTVLMRGGALIVPVGKHSDEGNNARAFYDALAHASEPDIVIQQLQGRSLNRGEQRAYLLAHVMIRHHLIATGPQSDVVARDSHFLSTRSMREAVELAENFAGALPRALRVRDALQTVPIYAGPYFGYDSRDDALIELGRFN